MPKNIGKFLVAGAGGLASLFLLAFFANMFFSSHGDRYAANGIGKSVMMDSSREFMAPQMMTEKLSFEADRRTDGSSDVLATDKKVIKNGSLNLKVQSIDWALEQIGNIVTEMNGNIFDSRFSQSSSGVKSGTVTVKVPVDRFSEAFTRLKAVATVALSESTTGIDVTAQYIDLQARINNKKAAEVTLQSLFERAVKISDVIEVTDKLATVRAEIESLEGQLRYLNAQTDMASITLSLTEDVTVVADQGFRPLQTMKESMATLIHMLGNLVQGMIRFLILGLPILLAYGVVLWLVYRLVRRVVKLWRGNPEEKKVISRKR